MSASHFIVLIDGDRAAPPSLAADLVRLGVEPICVADLIEAEKVVQSRQYELSGVMMPAHLPGAEIQNSMKSMQRIHSTLPAIAYGAMPDRAQRLELQRAGILLSLWDGYDEGILRFQINRLVTPDSQHSIRNSRRAPTHTPVRITLGGREKEGTLYSISEGGCFIETSRASMEGAQLQLVFHLSDVDYNLDGVVAFSNVPGNLMRPNLPLGMGVRFEDMPDGVLWQLADFIRDRLDSLDV